MVTTLAAPAGPNVRPAPPPAAEMTKVADATALLLLPLDVAIAFTVPEELIGIALPYLVDDVVGVEPSVV